jgi:hypothetical protein
VKDLNMKVKLQELIDEMTFHLEETTPFLNRLTGNIVVISDDEFRKAEEFDSLEHLSDWKQEELYDAFDILENGENYLRLPTKYDINEYRLIEEFCYSIQDTKKQTALINAIHGKGAFHRFKDKISFFEMEDQWYAFRDERYREMAIEWCEDHGVDYVE